MCSWLTTDDFQEDPIFLHFQNPFKIQELWAWAMQIHGARRGRRVAGSARTHDMGLDCGAIDKLVAWDRCMTSAARELRERAADEGVRSAHGVLAGGELRSAEFGSELDRHGPARVGRLCVLVLFPNPLRAQEVHVTAIPRVHDILRQRAFSETQANPTRTRDWRN